MHIYEITPILSVYVNHWIILIVGIILFLYYPPLM